MKKWLFVIVLAALLVGCRHEEKFSTTPHIEFVSIEKVDNGTNVDDQANLVFSFQDGDGDIGLDNADTAGVFHVDSAYYYNLFVDYYEKQNGVWTLMNLPATLNARIPHLSDNVPESIEGKLTILTYINNYSSPYDTVKLSFYLVDRALHKSNVVETPEIIIHK